jgi:hypothetical protein
MKAKRSTAPTKVSPSPERALEITQHQKMLEMKGSTSELLKTKGQIEFSSEFIENKQVTVFSRRVTERKGDRC